MKLFSRIFILVFVFLFFSSFSTKSKTVLRREPNLCEAVKKIVEVFEKKEVKKLLDAKIISEDQTQWSSKVKIERYKDEYIYDDGEDSYFTAVFDWKMNSADELEKELDAIVASLRGCLKVEPEMRESAKFTIYFFNMGDVLVSVSGTNVFDEKRSIVLKIEFNN